MLVGLTGGIGSGKSMVAQVFVLLGWKHFNSDQAAKDLYYEPSIKSQVKHLLGENAYQSNGALNTTYISSTVFAEPTLLKALNAIIHPAVGEKFEAFCLANANAFIIKESALLIETGLYKKMDKLVVVAAPEELRIRRAMERDRLSREMVIGKLNNQMSQEEKIKKADAIIVNDEQHSLIEQVMQLHQNYHKL